MLQDRYVLQQKIIDRFVKGESSASIAKALKMTRVQVNEHIDEWRQLNASNPAFQERGREAMVVMDKHFGMLLVEGWKALEEADDAGDYKTKPVILKTIADIEAKRLEALQKAGMLDDAELGEQLADAEMKFQAIKDMIKDVVNDCPRCRGPVQERLRKIFGAEEAPIVVDVVEAEYDIHEH